MASSNKTTSSLALFFCLNLLFFSHVTSHCPSLQPVPAPKLSPPSVSPTPSSNGGGPVVRSPTAGGPSPTTGGGNCSRSGLQIRLCGNAINLLSIYLGKPITQCCSLIQGLVNLEAAACVCNAIKVNTLGIKLNIIPINVVLNSCGRNAPPRFRCA